MAPPIPRIQSSFTQGEIGEKMIARTDFEGYYKAARKLRNVVVLPQGGIERRFGTYYADKINDIINDEDFKITVFEHKDSSIYIIIFVDSKILIYYDDDQGSITKVKTLNSPYTMTPLILPYISFCSIPDGLVIVHHNISPMRLKRTGSHTEWELNYLTFLYKPTYDFARDYDNKNFHLYNGSGGVFTKESNYLGYTCWFDCTVDYFTTDIYSGGKIEVYGGTLRILSKRNIRSVLCVIINRLNTRSDGELAFNSQQDIVGNLVFIATPAFSVFAGYPSKVCFYQGRIVFANTNTLPNVVFFSEINGLHNNQLNFDDTSTTADASFYISANSNKSDPIRAIISQQAFFALTKSGEYATSLYVDKPITFDNASLSLQSEEGSVEIDPVIIDGKLIYVEEGGNIIRAVTYSNDQQRFVSTNISLLVSHLINNPVGIAKYKNPNEIEGQFLFINNSNGELAILQIIEDQKILAWTSASTDGHFVNIASSGNNVYFITKRKVDGVNVYYLEKLDFEVLVDCAINIFNEDPSTEIVGLEHLNEMNVKVISNNNVVGEGVVHDGSLIINQKVGDCIVGLNFIPEIIPMPLLNNPNVVSDPYSSKHINTIIIDYYKTKGLCVNGQLLPYIEFGEDSFNPDLKTGFSKINILNGWDARQTISITQNNPYKMTIRAIAFYIDS